MRAKTGVYFAILSDVLSPDEIAARIGVQPSSVRRKASRRSDPPVPKVNAWEIGSGLASAAPLWQHLQALHELIAPAAGMIAELCQGEPTSVLRIVREFSRADEEADLGFWLDEAWMAILRQTGAQLDVDEYDFTVD